MSRTTTTTTIEDYREYKIISSHSEVKLAKKLNKLIKDNKISVTFKGGVCVDKSYHFHQAVLLFKR